MVGKYTFENGNETVWKYYLSKFPNLPERYFRKAYCEELEKIRKKPDPQSVVEITKGRPPILIDLDEKLVNFPSSSCIFGISASHVPAWVQSLYQHIGYTRRAGTTSRPLVPVQWMQKSLLAGYWQQNQEVWDSPWTSIKLRSIICIGWQINHGSKMINSHSHQRCHR